MFCLGSVVGLKLFELQLQLLDLAENLSRSSE
jgi:hypothetical protein